MANSYEELRFTDDFMFGKVMEDKELCRQVLECLLEHPVGELQDVQPEREFRYTMDGKPIRLDVYTKSRDTVYDAEMQNLNHKSVKDLELPRRSRFYQSMMDGDYLQKGVSYRKLPEGKILFICTFDPFGKGQARYIFENRCETEPELLLQDGTMKIFYNCTARTEQLSENVRALYEYILTGTGNDRLTRKIEAAVEKARCNEKWRSEYMKELLHDDDMRAEGREEGILGFVRDKLEDVIDKETILSKLKKIYSLTGETAEGYYERELHDRRTIPEETGGTI